MADIDSAKKLWEDLTILDDEWLKARECVIARKKPRCVYIQAHTYFTMLENSIYPSLLRVPKIRIAI